MLHFNIFKKILNKKIIIIVLITILLFSLYYDKNNLILETMDMRESLNQFEGGVKKMSSNMEESINTANHYLNEIGNSNGQIESFIENMDCENINIDEQSDGASKIINSQCNILNELLMKNENSEINKEEYDGRKWLFYEYDKNNRNLEDEKYIQTDITAKFKTTFNIQDDIRSFTDLGYDENVRASVVMPQSKYSSELNGKKFKVIQGQYLKFNHSNDEYFFIPY